MKTTSATNIDEYIESFPPAVQMKLRSIRELIHKEVPGVVEAIKYAIPTFMLNGNLVHFAAYEKHIGFYPTPSGTKAFQKELSAYKQGKGSVQFPIEDPVPLDLIKKIVAYRVAETIKKAEAKSGK